jgi:hypothetical protein
VNKIAMPLLLLSTFLPCFVLAQAPVSMFPPDIIESDDTFRDWYTPVLTRLGEKSLWVESSATHDSEVMRFLFVPGVDRVKGRNSTVIRIEIEGQTARLIARGEVSRLGYRTVRTLTNLRLSPQQITRLRELSNQADPWKFRSGTWNNLSQDVFYFHCTELIMERRLRSDYAVSTLSVSCEQPNRLMPLINYVVELSGQRQEDLRYTSTTK